MCTRECLLRAEEEEVQKLGSERETRPILKFLSRSSFLSSSRPQLSFLFLSQPQSERADFFSMAFLSRTRALGAS